jgi:hypothetical protein
MELSLVGPASLLWEDQYLPGPQDHASKVQGRRPALSWLASSPPASLRTSLSLSLPGCVLESPPRCLCEDRVGAERTTCEAGGGKKAAHGRP